MTIVFFSRLFYPHIGGVETHVMELSKLLVKNGHKVIVVTEELKNVIARNDSDEAIPTRLVKPNGIVSPVCELVRNDVKSECEIYNEIHIYRIPVGNNEKQEKIIIWKWLWKNRSLMERADIIHCHDVFYWYIPFRFLYPKKPVYTTFHGYEAGEKISLKAAIVRKISEYLSWGNICVGEFIAKWYGTKPTYVTYGGISLSFDKDPSTPHSTSSGSVGMTGKKIRITFIGRLEEDTGGSTYLKSLTFLKSQNFPYIFEACGDGSMRQEFEKYGKVHGFIENVQEKISQADVVFASSYLSILDALYLKKPVFAVYESVLKRDYLELTPFRKWIWIESNPKTLTKQITDYLNHKEKYLNNINLAYEWVKNQTWEKVKEMYYKLWKN